MNETNWVIRTVRQGKVRIHGQEFAPSERHMAYDGRLDGLRFAFARYRDYSTTDGYLPLIYLWGTEASFKNPDPAVHGWGPELVDGGFPWASWIAMPAPTNLDADAARMDPIPPGGTDAG